MNSAGTHKRVALGFLWNLAGLVVLIFKKLLFVPACLYFLNAQAFGEWNYIFAVAAYCSILNFGWDRFVINKLIILIPKSRSDANDFVTSNIFFITSYCTVFWFLFNLVVYLVGSDHFDILFWLSLYTFLLIPAKIIHYLYSTVDKYYRTRALVVGEELFQTGFIVLILYWYKSIQYLPFAYLIPQAIFTTYIVYDLSQNYGINIFSGKIKFSIFKDSFSRSLSFYVSSLSSTVLVRTPVVLIGNFISPHAVAIYATHVTLFNTFKLFHYATESAISPEVTKLFSLRQGQKVELVLELFVKASYASAFIFSVTLLVMADTFFKYFSSGKIVSDFRLMLIMAVGFVSYSIWESFALFLKATNLNKKLARLELMVGGGAMLGATLGAVLLKDFYIVAMLVACNHLVLVIFVPRITSRELGLNIIEIFKRNKIFCALMPVFSFCTFYFMQGINILWLRILILILFVCLVFVLSFVNFREIEKKELEKILFPSKKANT